MFYCPWMLAGSREEDERRGEEEKQEETQECCRLQQQQWVPFSHIITAWDCQRTPITTLTKYEKKHIWCPCSDPNKPLKCFTATCDFLLIWHKSKPKLAFKHIFSTKCKRGLSNSNYLRATSQTVFFTRVWVLTVIALSAILKLFFFSSGCKQALVSSSVGKDSTYFKTLDDHVTQPVLFIPEMHFSTMQRCGLVRLYFTHTYTHALFPIS